MTAYNAAVQQSQETSGPQAELRFAERPRGVFDVVVALFVALLLIVNRAAHPVHSHAELPCPGAGLCEETRLPFVRGEYAASSCVTSMLYCGIVTSTKTGTAP